VELLRRGYAVRTTVRSAAKEQAVRATISGALDPGGRLSFAVADLMSDDGWDEAVQGCDHVMHVASPRGGGGAENEDDLVETAREDTLRVLRAAIAAKVERVVMTSSCATASPPLNREEGVSEVAAELRAKLGASASKVPTRRLPDLVLPGLALVDPGVKAILPSLGRRHRHSSAKAERVLGWSPRPATSTVVDCAESLIVRNAL